MKRLIVLLMIAGLVAVGCQGTGQKGTAAPASSEAAKSAEPAHETGAKAEQLQQELSKLKEQLKNCADTSMVAFKEGVEKYETGYYTEAVEKFDEFIVKNPTSPLIPTARELRDRSAEKEEYVKKMEKKWDFSVSKVAIAKTRKEAGDTAILCPQIILTITNNSDKSITKLPIEAKITRATDDARFGSPIKIGLDEDESIEPGQSRDFPISTCGTMPDKPVGLLADIKINRRDYKRIFIAP